MGEKTNISWCDATFNPIWGCTKVSFGCDFCYAETFDHRMGGDHWGKGKPRRQFGDAHWNEPLVWDRKAESKGEKMRVFCGSMCDVMDDEWPDGVRERLWDLIDKTPNLIWQLLTKRPQRYGKYLPSEGFRHYNVWLGCTAETQEFFDIRFPSLGEWSALCGYTTWISYEPALGPITMKNGFCHERHRPDWIIFGGETGNNRRPMQLSWAESIKSECEEWGVKFFMKQMSARTPDEAKNLIPTHMLVQQFPK